MTDKVQKILNEITTRKLCTMDEHMAFYNDKAKEDYRFLSEIEELIKALQEEPVSEDLKKASIIHSEIVRNTSVVDEDFIDGAKWQKEQMMAKAIDAHVNYAWSGLSFGGFDWSKTGLDLGDKCKLIIIKED